MDDRRGKNTQLPLLDLLRQSIYGRLAGHEDLRSGCHRIQFRLNPLREDLESQFSVAFAPTLA
jgi:hypothetical protein